MLTTIEQWDESQMLTPAQEPGDARQDAGIFGANLTVLKGQILGIKTSDKKFYLWAHANADGTQVPKGIAMYSFKTDASGLVYMVTGSDAASPNVRVGPWISSPIWKNGIFDPVDLISTANPVTEIDTFTPANVGVGNTFTLTMTRNDTTTKAITFVATDTSAATVSAAIIALWNADPELAALATASGTTTVVLTGPTSGVSFSVASSATGGTATFTRVATQAPVRLDQANLITDWSGARVLHNGFIKFP